MPDPWPSLLRIAFLLMLAYGVTAVLAHFWSLRMIFPRPAASYVLSAEHVRLTAPDGVALAARYWANPEAKHTILWFYGNGEDLGTISASVEDWVRRGYAVFALDYRGYGHSGGAPGEATTYADATLALDWLRREKNLPTSSVVVLGFSLGGGPAVDLAAREPVGGLILIAPFVSAYRVMTTWPLLPGDKFINLEKIGRIRCPVLIMHGTADEMIPLWHGQRLFAAAPEPKRHLWVEGAGHSDVWEVAGERYWEAIGSFTRSL